MLTNQEINSLLGVTESYKSSSKLIKILFDNIEKERMFDEFLEKETNLTYDWFTNYFQEEHSDRNRLKQDFTPMQVARITNKILGKGDSIGDICAGTGGLTINMWVENKESKFYCEEYSDRTVPFLLFNLSIRNIEAMVWHGDSLSRECKNIFKLTKGDKYSNIEKGNERNIKCEKIIMNPPYSFKWNPKEEYKTQERFLELGILAPSSKADYAFVGQGLHMLEQNGEMAIILPHGVLFRGAAEGKIRKKIIEKNLLDAIIGLPEKTFLNTDIPTVILILKKNRTNKDILFIDSSKECSHIGKQNVMQEEHINRIIDIYNKRLTIDKFSKRVEIEEVEINDFNLNIPRYVDTFVKEEVKPLKDIVQELNVINEEISKRKILIAETIEGLSSSNQEDDKYLKEFCNLLKLQI